MFPLFSFFFSSFLFSLFFLNEKESDLDLPSPFEYIVPFSALSRTSHKSRVLLIGGVDGYHASREGELRSKLTRAQTATTIRELESRLGFYTPQDNSDHVTSRRHFWRREPLRRNSGDQVAATPFFSALTLSEESYDTGKSDINEDLADTEDILVSVHSLDIERLVWEKIETRGKSITWI